MYKREELSMMVENYIAGLPFAAAPRDLYAPIEYSLEQGGKRLRPLIVLMACNLFTEDVERALPCAAAVEVFHNFTLLHDDIMDNADVRRGKPAVHKKWSPNAAILSGDAMMIYAYTLLEKAPEPVLKSVFSQFNLMAMEVCEGQQYDMNFESMDRVSLPEYINMIKLKTAALLGRAIRIGAIVGGASQGDAQQLYDFCVNLGIAFQLQDDLLDTYGDDKTLGKKVGGDILEAKKTFLMINALQNASVDQRTQLFDILNDKTMEASLKIDRVREIYDQIDVRSITEEAILKYTDLALRALDGVAVDNTRLLPLKELAKGLINRQK